MSRVLPALWTYTKDQVMLGRQRLACRLVPSWYDQFCELNRLRTQNKALLNRIKQQSERSEDRDFKDAFDRLLLVDESTDGSFVEEPSRWSVASDIMDGSR